MSDVFQPEQVVGGRYRVVRKLGGGGMADVYLCEDLTLGRHVAVKVLLQRYLNDPTFVERFRREAKAAAGSTFTATRTLRAEASRHITTTMTKMTATSNGSMTSRRGV